MAKILEKREAVADRRPREKYNISTLIAIIVIVFFYAFMFLSPYFMSGTDNLLYDFSSKTINGRNMWVDSWIYCPETRTMEVVVALQDTSLTPDLIAQSAFRRVGKRQSGNAEIIISSSDIIVIRIPAVPSFDEVSLTLFDLSSNESVKWYNNSSAITEVSSIDTHTLTEYRVAQKEHEIVANQDIIAFNKEAIITNQNKIQDLQTQILALESSKKYQTATQIVDTNREISAVEANIKQLQSTNNQLSRDINEYEARISNLLRQIEDLKK